MPMSRRLAGVVGHVASADDHAPAVGAVEAAEQAQRGRLAAARRAEQRDQLAGLDVEVELVECDERAEAARQALEVDGDCAHMSLPTRARDEPRLPMNVIAKSSSQVISSESTESATATPVFSCPWLTSSTG